MKKILFTLFIIISNTICAQEVANELDCNISREEDDFTNEITIRTPLLRTVGVTKVILKGKTIYYLTADVYDGYCSVGGTGFTVLFTDGTKYNKNAKVDTNVSSSQYRYSVFIPITSAELIQFSKKKISKVKLYIFDKEVNETEANEFADNVKCILKEK